MVGNWALGLWAALLPALTFNVCYVLAITLDHLPVCFPYVSGCTSVSSTGRYAPESLVFRAGLLPAAVVMLLFWRRCAAFLQLGGYSGIRVLSLRLVGVLVAVSMAVYALTVGLPGDGLRLVRRIAINGFVLGTYAAQVVLVVSSRKMLVRNAEGAWRWLVGVCLVFPLAMIALEVAKALGTPRHATNNLAAWNSLLLQCSYFAAVSRLWWCYGFNCLLRLEGGAKPASPSE